MINTECLANQGVIMNSRWDIKDHKQPGRWPVSLAQVLQLRTSLETLLPYRVILPTAVVLGDSVGLDIDLVWGLGQSLEIFLRVHLTWMEAHMERGIMFPRCQRCKLSVNKYSSMSVCHASVIGLTLCWLLFGIQRNVWFQPMKNVIQLERFLHR